MNVKNIPIEKLRKGDFFTIKPRENPKPNQVYVFEGYDRYLKAYTATKFDDISVEDMAIEFSEEEIDDINALSMSDEANDIMQEHFGENLVNELRNQVDYFFAKDGLLKQKAEDINGRSSEYRPQQLAMALKIVEAISKGENLCVEAPTGVGKSFAYLIPLIYRAQFAKFPAVISTETINLQEQLINKDIPFLLKKIFKNANLIISSIILFILSFCLAISGSITSTKNSFYLEESLKQSNASFYSAVSMDGKGFYKSYSNFLYNDYGIKSYFKFETYLCPGFFAESKIKYI